MFVVIVLTISAGGGESEGLKKVGDSTLAKKIELDEDKEEMEG